MRYSIYLRDVYANVTIPAGLSPPVFVGASPPSPKAAKPARGDFASPPI